MNVQSKVASTRSCTNAIACLRQQESGPLSQWLHGHLFEHVLPFWQRQAIDGAGGIFTCLDDRGAVLSTDKWLWSQWRAVWVFSRIYNRLDRDARWLRLARHISDFCLRH